MFITKLLGGPSMGQYIWDHITSCDNYNNVEENYSNLQIIPIVDSTY